MWVGIKPHSHLLGPPPFHWYLPVLSFGAEWSSMEGEDL